LVGKFVLEKCSIPSGFFLDNNALLEIILGDTALLNKNESLGSSYGAIIL
jgi:hypothetical protein